MQSFIKKFLIISALIFPIAVSASLGIPHQFYGTVSFTGGETPDGLLVEAKLVEGTTIGTSITNDGEYGYNSPNLSLNLLFATDPQSTNAGKIVEFYVSGIKANQTKTFVNGESTKLNLTISGSIGTIEETDENATIENQTAVVTPIQTANIKLGSNLNIAVSSTTNTNATINKIEKLTSSFFTGSTAVIAGNNLLNAFEIDITGDDLNISVTITYDDTDIDEDTIKPYEFDGSSWVVFNSEDFNVNKSANTITFTISSAETPYAVFGEEPEPEPEPTSPSGGSTPTPTTPAPSPGPLSPEAQKVDANNDNRIDILDFNTLMVNWGSTLSDNIADFNKDSKIDIFDFNLLMIHWTG